MDENQNRQGQGGRQDEGLGNQQDEGQGGKGKDWGGQSGSTDYTQGGGQQGDLGSQGGGQQGGGQQGGGQQGGMGDRDRQGSGENR